MRTGNKRTTASQQLFNQLLTAALTLVEHDTDNADSLATYGKKRFGARFGDQTHKPQILSETFEGDE